MRSEMPASKVVFLDVDGVLNCLSRWKELPDVSRSGTKICPDATARLKRLIDSTGARIVVSSTWRIYYMSELVAWLTKHGITAGTVIGKTPDHAESAGGIIIGAPERGHEIQAWLNKHPEVTQFVILDDGDDMGELSHRLVRTTWKDGLQDEHIDCAVLMLGDEAQPVHTAIAVVAEERTTGNHT